MKKQFADLSKAEQKKIESGYHRMKPSEFDKLLSQAKAETTSRINRPARSRSKRNKSSDKKQAA